MWDWSPRGIEILLNDAQTAALERLNSGLGSSLEEEVAEQMNRYASVSEAALQSLLFDLIVRTRPPMRALGSSVEVPSRAPITEEEVIAAADPPPKPPDPDVFRSRGAPSLLGRLLGSHPAEAGGGDGQGDYEAARAAYERELESWIETLPSVRARLERERDERAREAERHNAAVAEAEARLASGPLKNLQTPIVETINEMLQGKDPPPLEVPLPRSISISFDDEAGNLLVDARIPGVEVVPPREFRPTSEFVPEGVLRPDEEVTELYRKYASSVALAVLNAALVADTPGRLRAAVFNGYVRRAEERPGESREEYVVSVRLPRGGFELSPGELSDPIGLLEDLGGRLTPDAMTMPSIERITRAPPGPAPE